MTAAHLRQFQLVEELGRHLRADPEVKALLLTGSLADPTAEVDRWSDVDLLLIVADQVMERYTHSRDWMPLSEPPVGLERHLSDGSATVRMALADGIRLDIVLIPTSRLSHASPGEGALFSAPCTVLWSRLPGLEAHTGSEPSWVAPAEITNEEVERRADRFWFRAVLAITRVARNDLLIGSHLALGLMRECLELQMLRRDRQEGTRAHRTGGWGNDLVDSFSWDPQSPRPERILDLIDRCSERFDQLASLLSPAYAPRRSLVTRVMAAARESCAGRRED